MVAINDWNDLDAVRNDLTASYTLETDLDSSTAGYTGIGDDFTPLGVGLTDNFNGQFDGQGYAIKDLVVSIDADSVGLFGTTNRNTTNTVIIENLTVSGSVTNTGTSERTAGLVGFSDSAGTGEIRNCVSHVDVTANTSEVGGISGRNTTTIIDSYATGSVDADSEVGGLVGESVGGEVTNSYFTGSVSGDLNIGGLIGRNNTSLKSSYAVGSVTGNTTVGGLVGYNSDTVTDSYADEETTGQTSIIGDYSGTNTNSYTLTTSEMQGEEASNTGNMDGFDYTNVWETVLTEDSDTSADGYPILLAVDRANQLDEQGILSTAQIPNAPTNLTATIQ